MARHKAKSGRISVFKGREAKLNKTIFHILALKGPQITYDIYKNLKHQRKFKHVRYATVNKRVRALEELGYINKTGVKETKAGFKAHIYELSARAYLAITLNAISLEGLVMQVDETAALAILSYLIHTLA